MVFSPSEVNTDPFITVEFSRKESASVDSSGQTTDTSTADLKIIMKNIEINYITSYFSSAVNLVQDYISQFGTVSKILNKNKINPTINTSFTRVPRPSVGVNNTGGDPRYFTVDLTIELANLERAVLHKEFQAAVDSINLEIAQSLDIYNNGVYW
jgi:hypothetical protein